MPIFNIVLINQAFVFEWYIVRCESKNGKQKDMC